MPGIIGKVSFDSQDILARAVLDRMLDVSSRPGSEIRAVFTAPGIALGRCGVRDRRLPPLVDGCIGTSDARNVRAVAYSQLTNAGELRNELERGGHRFSARTDEELIAHAYDRWGTRAFERLRGAFACAIWDGANRRLVLARDHVGVRSLYFAVLQGRGIVFASDVRALLQDPGIARESCPDGIDTYFALGYIPSPLTAYRQISKLQPAHYLVVEGRRLHLQEFWDLPVASDLGHQGASATAVATGLRAAVRRELKDVTRPSLLYSGGLASCALLSVAPTTLGSPITVHIDQDLPELARSDAAAGILGHGRGLETLAHPVSSLVEDLAAASGEPFADPSALTQLAVCTAAARHSDTALGGHGAATLWAGCERSSRLSRFASRREDEQFGMHAYALWEDRQRRSIYTRAFAWKIRDRNPFIWHLERWQSRAAEAPLDRALYLNARTLLPDNVLAIAGAASRAAGLSLRLPFVDYDMTELAMQTPMAVAQRGRHAMYTLRQLLSSRLPRRLRHPHRQRPVRQSWLRAALATLVPGMLLGPRFDGRDIVSRPALRELWNEHQRGRVDHSRRLWSLLMLEFWFREFIDGDAAAEPLEYAVLVKAA
jgi:asparagine synthase (glutamine-hydrolysing)